MAIGDDAAAAGMDLVAGSVLANTIDTEINKSRDYIAQRTAAVTPIAKGGTGATTAAAARNALGLGNTAGALPVANGGTGSTTPSAARAALQIAANLIPTTGSNVQADIDYIAGQIGGKVNKGGDTMSGDLYLPASSAASSGWTNAYINSDGRVCRGASSLRYKKFVTEFEPLELGNIFPTFHRFQMKADGKLPAEGKWRYGPIAEDMAAHADQQPFVVYRDVDGESVPDSVDFNALTIAQVAQLHHRAITAETRLAALEARLDALEADQ